MRKYTIVAPTESDANRIVDLMHKAFRFMALGIINRGKFITFETDEQRVRENIIPRIIFSGYSPNVKVNDDHTFYAEPFYRQGATDELYIED